LKIDGSSQEAYFSYGMVEMPDRRNSYYKYPEVIKDMRETGIDDDTPFEWDVLEYYLTLHFGSDPRTIRLHARNMLKFDFIRRAGPPLHIKPRKVIRRRKSGATSFQEYYSDNSGLYQRYVFGARAIRTFQETLNPKYVQPGSLREGEMKRRSPSLPKPEKNMCSAQDSATINTIPDATREKLLLKYLESEINKIENRKEKDTASHTYLGKESLGKDLQNEKNGSPLKRNVKQKEFSLPKPRMETSHSLPKPESSLGKYNKLKCPKCGKIGTIHVKAVSSKGRTYKYPYVAHYDPEKQALSWCYLGWRKYRELKTQSTRTVYEREHNCCP